MLLVPIVPTQTDSEYNNPDKEDAFIGIYNLDLQNVLTIEPNEDNTVTVYHRLGFPVRLALTPERFMNIIKESNLLNIYFLNDCEKIDKHVRKRFNLVGVIKSTNDNDLPSSEDDEDNQSPTTTYI